MSSFPAYYRGMDLSVVSSLGGSGSKLRPKNYAKRVLSFLRDCINGDCSLVNYISRYGLS